ncbi:DUF1684 domain-containing protein [Arenibacter sp. GZD96]|uniref:DUF1684 domain-containing protein n=1 Tax=Aurantibrevibacter litoralis TaxID=3106030 RepID=UPI002AFE042A|nr:DUF1684 domain-containing protein [Arenibacter sp. GZD-96]MEA1787032.1 DUF1684 domain-containing protein [Arenibacter sp. GZD-96]
MKYRILLLILLCVGCRDKKRFHDQTNVAAEWTATNALREILEFQKKLNLEFKDPENSPLPDRYKKDFEGLDFFPPDTTYRVLARLQRTPNALPFFMPSSTGGQSEETVYGIVHFELNGKMHQLEVYQNQELMSKEGYMDYLFLPFMDATNGVETYAGGRYLDLRIPQGDSLVIDFNKAYNPYCAYNKKYSCPIVPVVNTLNTAVKAGVKAFLPE